MSSLVGIFGGRPASPGRARITKGPGKDASLNSRGDHALPSPKGYPRPMLRPLLALFLLLAACGPSTPQATEETWTTPEDPTSGDEADDGPEDR
jgi:hypothetical protein